MTEELINLISEQLRNEFPESRKNYREAAVRLYNLVMLEQPEQKIIEARKILKAVSKIIEEDKILKIA